jgi:hypothetical protein
MNNSMILITSSWGNRKTFKMIPATKDCPYNEAIYDLDSKVLAVSGKDRKQSMHMIAKLTEMGDVQRMKIGKRENGKDYAEERKTLETFYEYYIEQASEVEEFIKMFCVNADTFDYKQYLNAASETTAAQTNILTAL